MRPQGQLERHTGLGFEVVLDPVVPQMVEQLIEVDFPVQGGGHGQGTTVQVEYISPAPGFRLPAPVVESIAPAPAVFQSPEPVVEYFSPAPAVLHATAPVVDHISPVPGMLRSPAPVLEHIAPAPRSSLWDPQLVEQLVEVPAPEWTELARGRDVAGSLRLHIAAGRQEVFWWLSGTRHYQWLTLEGITASPGRKTNTGQG